MLLRCYCGFAYLVLACIKMVGPVVLELEVKREKRDSLCVDEVDDRGHKWTQTEGCRSTSVTK
jgi:hypothetical protein